MPLDDLHKKKFKKNLAVLAGIFGFCVLIVIITMIKIANV